MDKVIKVTSRQGERIPNERPATIWQRRLENTTCATLMGFKVQATDGNAGHVDQVVYWTDVRRPDYVVVEKGRWLFNRKAVLRVDTIEDVDMHNRSLKVTLSREQIRQSPEQVPV